MPFLSTTSPTGRKILAATRFNGDGSCARVGGRRSHCPGPLRDIITALGSKPDRSGQPGVDQATVDKFFGRDKHLRRVAESGRGRDSRRGRGHRGSGLRWQAVRSKVDDYFARLPPGCV